jgi:NAD(P)-dependent dehydrogenase (short-subunit alcohol dehydrogenase family)
MDNGILAGKNAVIYGAAGSLGAITAKAMATAGANLFLVGRNVSSLRRVGDEIRALGGFAEAIKADATDRGDVDGVVQNVVQRAGSLDISFCLIDYQVVQNIALVDMNMEEFVRPVNIAMQSHFLTATAAGKIMRQQKTGVILSLTATPAAIGYPFTAGFAPACAAIETLSRNLACELGPYGVRAVNIRSGGSPESLVFRQARERNPEVMDQVVQSMEQDTMLKRLPSMEDIANTAVFLASEIARSITGVTVDVTVGTTAALNYRVPRADSDEAADSTVGP